MVTTEKSSTSGGFSTSMLVYRRVNNSKLGMTSTSAMASRSGWLLALGLLSLLTTIVVYSRKVLKCIYIFLWGQHHEDPWIDVSGVCRGIHWIILNPWTTTRITRASSGAATQKHGSRIRRWYLETGGGQRGRLLGPSFLRVFSL